MTALIWWMWTAYPPTDPAYLHTFEVLPDSDDVAWLGEGAWVFRADNAGIGLR